MDRARCILVVLAVCVSAVPGPAHAAGTTTRVGFLGFENNNESFGKPDISADGRFVAFTTEASLLPLDVNTQGDLYVYDRLTSLVQLASSDVSGLAVGGGDGSISGDGSYVAFSTYASLVPSDTNNKKDIYVRHMRIGWPQIIMISSPVGAPSNGNSIDPSMSDDSLVISFTSTATNLVPNDTNGKSDIFVADIRAVATSRVSVRTDGGEANGNSAWSAVSADGRSVTFSSAASNLDPIDANGVAFDVYVRDRVVGATSLVSKTSAGQGGNGPSWFSSISGNGDVVAFQTGATNFHPPGNPGYPDVYTHDRSTGVTSQVSLAGDGEFSPKIRPVISPDGTHIAFESEHIHDLAVADFGIVVRNLVTGSTFVASHSMSGEPADGSSLLSTVTVAGGQVIVGFTSFASNLVAGDTNGKWDTFLHVSPA